jgi:hypothetical protein
LKASPYYGPRAKAAIPVLEKLRNDPSDSVALAAHKALKKIRGK